MNWLTKHLVDDWNEATSWLSIRIAAIAGLVTQVYDLIPNIQAFVSERVFRIVTGVAFVLVIIGRLKK